MGLFTDSQILPAGGLFTLAAGWFYAGAGGVVARTVVAALLVLPVAVMVADNRVGGMVVERVGALSRWHRRPGVFAPGSENAEGYELLGDEKDQLLRERERLAAVDLEAVFTRDEQPKE